MSCGRLLVASLGLALAATLIAQDGLTGRQEQLVDLLFHQYDRDDTPGAVVGIVKGGEFVYKKAFGMADMERNVPLSTDMTFYVASVSKQFTTTLILLLEEEGKLAITDDIRKYLPEMQDYGHTITIRHLMNHTSGVRDIYYLRRMRGEQTDAHPGSPEDFLELLTNQKALNFTPGERYLYSNGAYFLLRLIVERVRGESFEDFAEAKIFGPLEMGSSSFHRSPGDFVKNRAINYTGSIEGGWSNRLLIDYVSGPRGLRTTLNDMAKWTSNFTKNALGGGDQSLIERLVSRSKFNSGRDYRYANGIENANYKGKTVYFHGGDWLGYRAFVSHFPEHDTSIIILGNIGSLNTSGLNWQIADTVIPGLDHSRKPGQKTIDGTGLDHSKYVGLYRARDGVFINVLSDGEKLYAAGIPGGYVEFVSEETLWEPGLDAPWIQSDGLSFTYKFGDAKPTIIGHPPFGDIVFEKVERVEYDEDDLKEFEGTFYSEEIDATHVITFANGRLSLSINGNSQSLSVTEWGEFRSRVGMLMFNQDRSGYEITSRRAFGVKFKRVS